MDLRIYGSIYDDNDTMSALPWFHLCSEGPHAAVCVVATVGQYVQHSRSLYMSHKSPYSLFEKVQLLRNISDLCPEEL